MIYLTDYEENKTTYYHHIICKSVTHNSLLDNDITFYWINNKCSYMIRNVFFFKTVNIELVCSANCLSTYSLAYFWN